MHATTSAQHQHGIELLVVRKLHAPPAVGSIGSDEFAVVRSHDSVGTHFVEHGIT